jgi:hypothetical protein
MGWHPFDLDHHAQEIVLKARERSKDTDTLGQAYKMRANCAFGLERFWGEHLRLKKKEPEKAKFVADVWRAFVGIMASAGIKLPGEMLCQSDSEIDIKKVTDRIWNLNPQDRQAALAVLTSLCDSIVWWTQRLKLPKGDQDNG